MKRLCLCLEDGVSVPESRCFCVDNHTAWENCVSTSFVSVLCTLPNCDVKEMIPSFSMRPEYASSEQCSISSIWHRVCDALRKAGQKDTLKQTKA